MMKSIYSNMVISLSVLLFLSYFRQVIGHGHLYEPPSRSSMWQQGFRTPPNYNMNQLNCGGRYNHWVLNKGQCGLCGDPFQAPQPRDNESGGKYGKGIVTRTYKSGDRVTLKVLITANHEGWFEFKLCPDGSPTTPVTQDCLDKYVLPLADGSGTRYSLGPQERYVSVDVMLPPGLTCSQCVLQWRWKSGNSFGIDPDGTSCKGCGIQEEFYGCSDIAITPSNGQAAVTIATVKPTTRRPQTAAPIVTLPRITFPKYTNNVQTMGTPKPTTNHPFFTRPTYAPPTTSNQPITKPAIGGVTFPAGFVPISVNPGMINPTATPIRTNPPFTRTTAGNTPSPSTTSRLQLITTNKPNPTNFPPTNQPITRPPFGGVTFPAGFVPISTKPNGLNPTAAPIRTNPPITTSTPQPTPSTTQTIPSFTFPPFTFFPPFINNNGQTSRPTVATSYRPPIIVTQPKTPSTTTFYRPPTTAQPIKTTPRPTRPTTTPYRPPIIVTRPKTPSTTTFYRPPTTARPQTTAPPPTTQAPPVVTSSRLRCFAINAWAGVDELENYCRLQCTANGFCPSSYCGCTLN